MQKASLATTPRVPAPTPSVRGLGVEVSWNNSLVCSFLEGNSSVQVLVDVGRVKFTRFACVCVCARWRPAGVEAPHPAAHVQELAEAEVRHEEKLAGVQIWPLIRCPVPSCM